MSITVRDLAKKLAVYARQSEEHAKTEVMLDIDGTVAFPFNGGVDHMAFGPGGICRFLVFKSDMKSDLRLMLERKEISA